MKTSEPGRLGVQWRLPDQRRFPTEQTVNTKTHPADGWQDHEIRIPASDEIIHLRVLLPSGNSAIRRIEIADKTGETVERWTFGK